VIKTVYAILRKVSNASNAPRSGWLLSDLEEARSNFRENKTCDDGEMV